MASLQSASAWLFWARDTWVALQREKRESSPFASAWSGISFESLTRHRPWSCSTMSFESSSISTASAPSSWARARARSTAAYSATLFVWTPRYSEMDAIGGASGRRDAGPTASIRTAPSDAGPGLPRAAPSVRTMRVRSAGDAGPAGRPGAALPEPPASLPDPGAPTDSQRESQPGVIAALSPSRFSRVAPRSPRRPRGSPW